MSYYGKVPPMYQPANTLPPQPAQMPQYAPAPQSVNTGHHHPCPPPRCTLLRIFIPAGAVINLANLIEASSPSGICLIVSIPLFGGNLNTVVEAVRKAGGTVEFA